VTVVDKAGKLNMLRAMGADHVIDYEREDFTRSGKRYDLILDVKTNRSPFDYARALNPNGTYATVGGDMPRLLQFLVMSPFISLRDRKRVRIVMLKPNKDLAYMNELFEAGKLVPVIDGPYKFADVREAFRLFGSGNHKGKIIVTMA
jgi:NADPH:quinone reductase-like Zn-dependent oxidoreductase